jgi:hypothetical protein
MENQLATKDSRQVAFFESSMQTLKEAMEYANMLLKSKVVPNHFYEKDANGKPDFTKGKPEAVVMTLQAGMEVGLKGMQALQWMIPVNGLMSIKGDGAKALIFNSGKLKESSWKEDIHGDLDAEDYSVQIWATRSDNDMRKSGIFSVSRAKRAGLWVTEQMINSQGGAKYKYSPWWKYPERMIYYRALGFLARDLFSDVLGGLVTEEEARDYPEPEGTVELKTALGETIELNKDNALHNQERSKKLTERVDNKINQANDITEDAGKAIAPDKSFESNDVAAYTPEELDKLGDDIYDVAKKILPVGLFSQLTALPGRKSKKRYKEFILAFYQGVDVLSAHIEAVNKRYNDENPESSTENNQEVNSEASQENNGESDTDASVEDNNAVEPENTAIKKPIIGDAQIHVPELGESGERAFDEIYDLYGALEKVGITQEVYSAYRLGGPSEEFINLEELSKKAPVSVINEFLEIFRK